MSWLAALWFHWRRKDTELAMIYFIAGIYEFSGYVYTAIWFLIFV